MGERLKAIGRWVADFRWAMNAMRARRWRRSLSFSDRIKFDDALRPRLPPSPHDNGRRIIAYPDAVYHITVDDLIRAMFESDRP